MDLEEALRHAGRENERELEERARNALPTYLFVWGTGKKKRLFCTNCLSDDMPLRRKTEMPAWAAADPYVDSTYTAEHPKERLGLRAPAFRYDIDYDNSGKHLHYGSCPVCGSMGQYRLNSKGKKHLTDRVFLIRYRRSAIEERALVMVGYLAICGYGDWDEQNERAPEIYTDLREICVFRPGQPGERFTKKVSDWGVDGLKRWWTHPKSCVGGYDPWRGCYGSGTEYLLDEWSLRDAIRDTWLETTYDRIAIGEPLDRIDFFARCTRYPCIEYLEKLGFHQLARAAVEKTLPRGLLNLNGKTGRQVLRVDADTWSQLKGKRIDASPGLLHAWHEAKRLKLRLGVEALDAISRRGSAADARELVALLREKTGKAARYMDKTRTGTRDMLDHVKMLNDLKIPLTDEMICPRDFRRAHNELAQRMAMIQSAKAEQRVKKRAEELAGWRFSALGLTIRPMMSAAEINREGAKLHHCVARYIERYADGDTILLALREDERLDTPYRTVEFSTAGQLIQCRGDYNRSPGDEQPRIEAFFRLFAWYRAEYEKSHKKAKRIGGHAA